MRKAALFMALPASLGMSLVFPTTLSAATYTATGTQSQPPPNPCPTTVVNGHPENCQGFVLDGSPQQNDDHCVGTPEDRVRCVVARRPECINVQGMSSAEISYCWAPGLNQYSARFSDVDQPWSSSYMLNVLTCESGGWTGATNGHHHSLLQENEGSYDAAQNIIDGHNHFFVGGGYEQWTCKG